MFSSLRKGGILLKVLSLEFVSKISWYLTLDVSQAGKLISINEMFFIEIFYWTSKDPFQRMFPIIIFQIKFNQSKPTNSPRHFART